MLGAILLLSACAREPETSYEWLLHNLEALKKADNGSNNITPNEFQKAHQSLLDNNPDSPLSAKSPGARKWLLMFFDQHDGSKDGTINLQKLEEKIQDDQNTDERLQTFSKTAVLESLSEYAKYDYNDSEPKKLHDYLLEHLIIQRF